MASEKKSGTGNRREFIRTEVPLAERVASFIIVVLLVGIGVAIAIKGKHFNPDIFAVRTDSLKSTTAAVEGKAGTAPSTPASAGENPASVEAPKSVAEKPAAAAEAPAEG